MGEIKVIVLSYRLEYSSKKIFTKKGFSLVSKYKKNLEYKSYIRYLLCFKWVLNPFHRNIVVPNILMKTMIKSFYILYTFWYIETFLVWWIEEAKTWLNLQPFCCDGNKNIWFGHFKETKNISFMGKGERENWQNKILSAWVM